MTHSWLATIVLFALVCLVAACSSRPAAAQVAGGDGPTIEAFAATVGAALAAAGRASTYDQADASLRLGGESRLALDALYREYRKLPPAERPAFVASLVGTVTGGHAASDAPLDEVRAQLLPLVREGLSFDSAVFERQIAGNQDPAALARRTLTDVLCLGLAVDHPSSISIIGESDLTRWKTSFDATMKTALANLRRMSGQPFTSPRPGLYVSPWKDSYDASRVLLLDVIGALKVKGTPVAFVPSQNMLLVTGDRDAGGLLAAADLAEEELQAPRAQNVIALRLEGGHWKTYLPDVTAAVHARYAHMARGSYQRLYGEQGPLLQKLHAKRGEDIYVAKYTVVVDEEEGKHEVTYAFWPRGVVAELPRAEVVGFIDPAIADKDKRLLGFAPWARVAAVVGPLAQPLGWSPERYRVRAFPSPEQLAKLALQPTPFLH